MKIAFACDHKGFILKEAIVSHIRELGHTVVDCGTDSTARVDYPVYGEKAARLVASGECDLGILVCGTGIGISLAANRVKGIRAICCSDPYTAQLGRNHNNSNMLAIGAMVVGEGLALKIVDAYLDAQFMGGRHAERLKMIEAINPD